MRYSFYQELSARYKGKPARKGKIYKFPIIFVTSKFYCTCIVVAMKLIANNCGKIPWSEFVCS
jgi:hypothetical protein